jgi:hypothetical protein
MGIKSISIFPPLAVARLGSSPIPLENYDLDIVDAISPRQIVPAVTLVVDQDGNITEKKSPGPVNFRDEIGLIRPVAPFFEIWAQTDEDTEWQPLTKHLLKQYNLLPSAVRWKVHVGNLKIFRRTNDPNDQIKAVTGSISDHARHKLLGECKNFLDNEKLPLGFVQYARPSDEHPEVRLRFTPAHGKVYGSDTGRPDPNVVKPIYDPRKGKWCGYSEPDTPKNDFQGRVLTNPAEIFAGYDDPKDGPENSIHISYGYVDDECDGIIEASLDTHDRTLTGFARVAAGPPTFAPDSKPVRTVADELEQAMFGPAATASPQEMEEVKDIVRRALETVRLMNTAKMNNAGTTRGVGMARMDILDYSRKSEPIFDPEVADSLAIRTRHERVLLGLESGSLAWFARILRAYDEVGNLTDAGRRRMPGMMRNADGRHLSLTRRQVAKVKAVAEYIVVKGVRPEEAASASGSSMRPVNLAAQLDYRAKGNPPSTKPDTAISNAYPGLEMDFRNVWRRILEGIVLHESLNFVVEVERSDWQELKGMLVLRIAGVDLTAPVTGPDNSGTVGPLKNAFGSDRMALEWSNALATVIRDNTGEEVECQFQSIDGKQQRTQKLKVRRFFEAGTAVISREIAEPGALTQSLCAPWQNDYRECACFYWAANRPDFVNVEVRPDGMAAGNNWMQKDRTAATAKVYINDDWLDDRMLSHTDLISDWEKVLRFVIGNRDEPPVES